MATSRRIYWAVYAAGISQFNSTSFTAIQGLQSVGLTTTFNLDQVFQIGQLAIYEQIEDVPDIEVTLEKVLDGEPLIYHLATRGASSGTLAGRSGQRCGFAMSLFDDTLNSASGTPIQEVHASGMYVSSVSYTFPVDGNSVESVTLVGNNVEWSSSPSLFTGQLFENDDTPASGVQRRWDVLMAHPARYPTDIPGISSSGTNDQVNQQFKVHFQNITVSADFGRDAINELGRKGPYFRYVNFPVEVTSEFEIISIANSSDTRKSALEEAENLTDQTIVIRTGDSTQIDLGSKNKLNSISYGGADAGGGNMTETYSYVTYNDFTVTHDQDPG